MGNDNTDATKCLLNVCCRQLNKREEKLLGILLTTLDHLGFEMFQSHGQENSNYLNQIVSGNPF